MKNNISIESFDSELGKYAPFLISLSDGSDEELNLVITKSETGDISGNFHDYQNTNSFTSQALSKILKNTHSIEPSDTCQYKICFHSYIVYQIRNESYCSFDSNEVCQGKYFIVFKESRLLSSLGTITDAQQLSDGTYYPNAWKQRIYHNVFTLSLYKIPHRFIQPFLPHKGESKGRKI